MLHDIVVKQHNNSLRLFVVAAKYHQQQDSGVQYEGQDKGHHSSDGSTCWTSCCIHPAH